MPDRRSLLRSALVAAQGAFVASQLGCHEPVATVELGNLGVQKETTLQMAGGSVFGLRVSYSFFECTNANAVMLERTLLHGGKIVLEDTCDAVEPPPNRRGGYSSPLGGSRWGSSCDIEVPEGGADRLRLSTHAKHSDGELVARGLEVALIRR